MSVEVGLDLDWDWECRRGFFEVGMDGIKGRGWVGYVLV